MALSPFYDPFALDCFALGVVPRPAASSGQLWFLGPAACPEPMTLQLLEGFLHIGGFFSSKRTHSAIPSRFMSRVSARTLSAKDRTHVGAAA